MIIEVGLSKKQLEFTNTLLVEQVLSMENRSPK